MPSVNVYLTDEVYGFLLKLGKPSKVAKKWIEEKYKEEKRRENGNGGKEDKA